MGSSLHTPELLHEVILCDLLWSHNFPVEQQLLLWREPGVRGKHKVLQLCGGNQAEGCGEQRLLCLEGFFQVVVLKKGNKQSKETSPVTACLPAKAFFGQGWPLASLATKELARTSYFRLHFCGGSFSVHLGAPSPRNAAGLSRDTGRAGEGRARLGMPVPWATDSLKRRGRFLEQSKRMCREGEASLAL